MREVHQITSTYRELSETIRNFIRPCYKCEFKRTTQCSHCPPSRIRNDLLAVLSYANKKLKEDGIYLCSNRKEDELIITIDKEETDVDLDAVLQFYK